MVVIYFLIAGLIFWFVLTGVFALFIKFGDRFLQGHHNDGLDGAYKRKNSPDRLSEFAPDAISEAVTGITAVKSAVIDQHSLEILHRVGCDEVVDTLLRVRVAEPVIDVPIAKFINEVAQRFEDQYNHCPFQSLNAMNAVAVQVKCDLELELRNKCLSYLNERDQLILAESFAACRKEQLVKLRVITHEAATEILSHC